MSASVYAAEVERLDLLVRRLIEQGVAPMDLVADGSAPLVQAGAPVLKVGQQTSVRQVLSSVVS